MGDMSTSDSAVFGSRQTQSSPAFNLHSWQGLTEVLRVGKISLKDPIAYADFRNLVLQYAQQGGDIELRKQIDAIVATFKKDSAPVRATDAALNPVPAIQPDAVTAIPREMNSVHTDSVASIFPDEVVLPEVEAEKPAVLGVRRVIPMFRSPAVHNAPQAVVVPQSTPPPTILDEVSVPPPKLIPPIPPAPKSIVEEVVTPEVVPPTPPIPSAPPVIPVEALASFKTVDQHKARITEIKRLVNTHVGNPATLIDSHNVEGRLYMSALLGALKAVGGNGTESVDSAMAKLEDAFTKISARDYTKETPKSVPEVVPPPIVTESLPDVSEVARTDSDTDVVFAPIAEFSRETVSQNLEPSVGEKENEQLSGYAAVAQSGGGDTPESTEEASGVVLREEAVTPPVIEEEIPQTPPRRSVADTLSALLAQHKTDDVRDTATHVSHVPAMQVMPHSKEEVLSAQNDVVPVKNPSDFPLNKHTQKEIGKMNDVEELKTEHAVDVAQMSKQKDELLTSEITEALNQLLHEWSLFSGSGLFGTGPGGLEHPLYKKLAYASMNDVVAGKWEGASPNVTKTIKQYVDAWRHEQGVAYTINETFEHYLRRVVQRILKRQG